MKAVVLHPGTANEAIRSRQATREIAASKMPVLPSKTLTAHQRVDVYREMYWMRLREAMSIDYPELRRLLGFRTRYELDGFLKAHEVYEDYTMEDFERERAALKESGF